MKQKVYLAGGMDSDWRQRVKRDAIFTWFDPKTKEEVFKRKMMPVEYTNWDLHFIDQCDVLFVYVEKDNPSCIGLAAEIGYARGINKTIVLVLEENNKFIKDKYFCFIRECSTVVYDNLEHGIEYLYSFTI